VKWNRETIKVVVIVFATIIFTSFVIKFAFDHDGETLVLFGDDATSTAPTATAATTSVAAGVETGDIDPESGLAWVLEDDLPVEGQGTLALIDQGGPFPYDQDGSTFGNFEGLLPDHPQGYYSEDTVLTPASTDRGARRIVTGDGGEYYWTQDHYESFERIARRLS
jgi:ribonuclease T1